MSSEANSELKEAAVAYRTALDFPALDDPRYPVHLVADQIKPYLRVIVERFHPERIILFGSYAYGQPDSGSDFDLLIIRRDIASEKASNLEIAKAFWDVPGPRPAFTILSKTPERIAERLLVKSSYYEDIIGKGLEVYAAT